MRERHRRREKWKENKRDIGGERKGKKMRERYRRRKKVKENERET